MRFLVRLRLLLGALILTVTAARNVNSTIVPTPSPTISSAKPTAHRYSNLSLPNITAQSPVFAPPSLYSAGNYTNKDPNLPNLPLNDINIVVLTDVHSWVAGHAAKEPMYDADYGTVLSFVQRLKDLCLASKQDVFFVMNGDWNDGTGANIITACIMRLHFMGCQRSRGMRLNLQKPHLTTCLHYLDSLYRPRRESRSLSLDSNN
jgi:2',3'-cyclic-nucleotide 2'-phosphodiesterase (5'-nucleotidase family)